MKRCLGEWGTIGRGRTISHDDGAQWEAAADVVANGMEGGTGAQRDAPSPDAPDEPLVATTDVAPLGLDAAFDSASDTGIADAGRQLDLASLDTGPDVGPSQIPSRQSARFTIESQRRGWAVVDADLCGAINIERQNSDGSWRALVLGIPYQCGCECPVPLDFAGLESLARSPMLTWDARELAIATEVRKCPTIPGQTQDMPVLHQFPQPVAPGHYRVRVPVLDSLPRACTEQPNSGRTSCSQFCSNTSPAGICSLREYQACPGDRTATAEFDLPESGDVAVDLLVT